MTTTAARKRCSKGHLIPIDCTEYCKTCNNAKLYHKKRSLGLSSVRSRGYTPEGHSKRKKQQLDYYYLNHKEIKRKKQTILKNYRSKMIEKYGGRIDQNTVARLRYLIDKEGIQTTSD